MLSVLSTYELAPWFIGTLKIVVGPLTGAFAGAWAAQGIARKNAEALRDLQEARATSLAIGTTHSIVNVVASLKRQHVKPMKEAYDGLYAQLKLLAKTKAKPFEYEADFKVLLPLVTSMPILEKILTDRISLPPGVMGLFALLTQSIGNLNNALASRNEQVHAFRVKPDRPPEELAQMYFGLPNKAGMTDTRFPDTLSSIALYTDDTILFGILLENELVKHGRALFGKGRKGFPYPPAPNVKQLEDAGLMPSLGEVEMQMLKSLQIEPSLSTSA